MALNVGFIGLGIMGQPMAQNVVKGGHALTVFNRSSEKAKSFGDAGATVVPTPKAVAQASDVIILMLAGPEAIDAVLEGPDGLMAGLQAGQTLVLRWPSMHRFRVPANRRRKVRSSFWPVALKIK
jgi:3-hydroxyisobutyrate dehydrogenase-like beta-hydroxyacid dehydrogenase